jgi:hypothetical protein
MTIHRATEAEQFRVNADDEDDLSVPIELFGNDHWTVFLRVDEAVAENDGILNPDQLNIAYSKRSSFAPTMRFTAEYPTQVKASETVRGDGRFGVKKVKGHDSIDCLADLERAGLVEADLPHVDQDRFIDADGSVVLGEDGEPLNPFDAPEILESAILSRTRWKLTEYGTIVAFQLRVYKESGKPLHSFVAEQPQQAF